MRGVAVRTVDVRVNCCVVFFQAEDGIRDLVRSRGLGDVYKRQAVLLIGRAEAEGRRCWRNRSRARP